MHEAQAILLRLLRFAPGPAWHRNPAPRRTYPRRPVLMPSSRPEICPGYAAGQASAGVLCEAGADQGRPGGLRGGALLGARAASVGARGGSGADTVCEAVRQAEQ